MAKYSPGQISDYLRDGDLASTTSQKGKAFEDLACYLFSKVPGIIITQRNTLNSFETEEIDVAFFNTKKVKGGLYFLPHIFLVECKNWSGPVSSIEVNWFASKLESRSIEIGVLIAAQGITGNPDERNRAHFEIAKYLAKKIHIIVITRQEIEQLTGTEQLVYLIQRKLTELSVAGTLFV
jgi:hypothetical protein